jgi:hypothetical protein
MDDGTTWATSRRPMRTGEGTFGLATLRDGRMLAEYQGRIYLSGNGGCNWRPIGPIQDSPLRLVGAGGSAYAWNLFSSREAWRIDVDAPRAQRIVRLANMQENVIGIGVDPFDDLHVRAVGGNGGLFDSTNGGASWVRLGTGAPVTPIVYFAAFDPNDIDHVVVGMVSNGITTTLDGGTSWTSASGLTQTGGSRNSFSGVIAESNPSIVWVMSIDIDENLGGAPSNGRHLYRSGDGGLSFTPVVDGGNGVVLVNGPVIAADPSNPNLVYFPFGGTVFGNLLQLHRYNHATGEVSWTTTTTTPHARVRAMVFSPQHPGRLVVGFEGS